jgi:copper chaperone CopZ
MKPLFALSLLTIALFTSGIPAVAEDSAPVTVEVKVPEIVCTGCAWSITQELKKLDNVTDVYVDAKSKKALVETKSDSNPGEKAILAAVKAAGYEGSGYHALAASFADAKADLTGKKK